MSRLAHFAKVGRANTPPWYAPTSFWNRPISAADKVAADQTQAKMLGNAMNYGNSAYSYNGAAAPSFFGYSGTGYGLSGTNYPFSVTFNGRANSSYPIFCVRSITQSANVTIQKVGIWLVVGGVDTVAGTRFNNLQSFTNSVPIPLKSLCPMIDGTTNYLDIWAGGSDQSCAIWDLDTDLFYELYRLDNRGPADMQSAMGCTWTAQGGAVYPLSTSNSILSSQWGHRACSIGLLGGVISTQDMRDVYEGKGIEHALAITTGITKALIPRLPASRADGVSSGGNYTVNIPSGFPGAGTPNPAYQVDYSQEGARFFFPPGTDFSGCTYPLSKAVARAIQKYGMMQIDNSGGIAFFLEDDRTAGSPYDLYGANVVTPWQGTANKLGRTPLNWNAIQAGTNNDPTHGALTGGVSIFNQLPWSKLQILDPISS